MDALETFEVNDLIVRIYQDDTGGDGPRDWDNVGHMLCWHPDYVLGDEQFSSPEDVGGSRSMEEVSQWLIKERGAVVMLPLYLYDHSGISMSSGSAIRSEGATTDDVRSSGRYPFDGAGWDTSMVGFIYATAKANEEAPHGDMWEQHEFESGGTWQPLLRGKAKVTKPWVIGILEGEVETYNQFLTGDVYGYNVYRKHAPDCEIKDCPHDEIVDSCWGFYGMEDVKAEAKAVAEAHKEEVTV